MNVTAALTPGSFEEMLVSGMYVPSNTATQEAALTQLEEEQKGGQKEKNDTQDKDDDEAAWLSRTSVWAVTVVANGYVMAA